MKEIEMLDPKNAGALAGLVLLLCGLALVIAITCRVALWILGA